MPNFVDAALRQLPAWAGWSFVVLEVVAAFGLALIASSAGATFAMRPLRAFERALREANANTNINTNRDTGASGENHDETSPADEADPRPPAPMVDPAFAERARFAYPSRLFTAYSALVLPAILAAYGIITGGGHLSRFPPILAAGLAWTAALLVTLRTRLRVEREIRRIALPALRWLRGAFTLWIIMMPHFLVALAVSVAMPPELGLEAFAYLLGGAALVVYLAMGGTLHVLRLLRLARPASPRLASIVASVAAKTGVRTRGAFELVLPWANAYALPLAGRLGFTDEVVEELRDEELAAVCAHELGHLSEGRRSVAVRIYAIFALYVPLALAKPLLAGGNPGRFGAALLGAYASLFLARRFFRRMEVRADKAAHTHEGDHGTYARALARIYEVNAMPVVLHNQAGVHPDLYDRLTASGAAPSYPRPKPPPRLRALGALGIAAATALVGSAALHAGLRGAARALAGSSSAAAIAAVSASGDAQSIGQLGRAFEGQGNLDAAAAMFRIAAGADDRSIDYPTRLAVVLARSGRCEEADAAAADAEDRAAFYGISDEDGVVAEARRAQNACLEQMGWPTR
jgi:Zn-dependent protease with chaperone function